jgi:hypothetical protein
MGISISKEPAASIFRVEKKLEAVGYSEPLIPSYYDTLRHIANRTSTLYNCEWGVSHTLVAVPTIVTRLYVCV